jgi:hypothetical protein
MLYCTQSKSRVESKVYKHADQSDATGHDAFSQRARLQSLIKIDRNIYSVSYKPSSLQVELRPLSYTAWKNNVPAGYISNTPVDWENNEEES